MFTQAVEKQRRKQIHLSPCQEVFTLEPWFEGESSMDGQSKESSDDEHSTDSLGSSSTL